ncbi:hypothetical protein Salat_2417700 [Sesamum alatum]|uniref:Uncharacterized protein n=1 Tax=Sesamum alatum TaxID=300844 RepID=A0AAE2CFB8_9LAMI|nr:hypothetical protein Salat_2417700 [Sesamum alatum]
MNQSQTPTSSIKYTAKNVFHSQCRLHPSALAHLKGEWCWQQSPTLHPSPAQTPGSFSPSLLAATLNLFALFSIGSKYVRAMGLHDQTWSEYNYTARILNQTGSQPLEFSGFFSPGNNYIIQQQQQMANADDRQWRDRFTQRRRYAVLGVCMVLFIAFTGVTLSGPWHVTCKHDRQQRKHPHPYDDMDCLKFCDGPKCLIFCQGM